MFYVLIVFIIIIDLENIGIDTIFVTVSCILLPILNKIGILTRLQPNPLSLTDPGRFWPDARRLLWSTADDHPFFLLTNMCQLPLTVQRIPPLPPIVRDRDVEHQTQHTDDVRLFIGIIDTYTWCNNKTNVTQSDRTIQLY